MTKVLFACCTRVIVVTAALLYVVGSASVACAQTAPKPLKIIIYGGSGRIGSRITSEALSRGHIVTVVVRKPEEVGQTGRQLKVAKGDVLDTAAVTKQIAGEDIVVAAINSRDIATFVDGGKSLIAALRHVGARPPGLIWIGGASSLKDDSGRMLFESNPIPNAPSAAAPGHIQVLKHFQTVNDVPWTFFSPAINTAPGERTGKFRLGGDHVIYDADGKSSISMEDLAVATIDEAEKPTHIHARFTIGY